jgi:hypothetical protein
MPKEGQGSVRRTLISTGLSSNNVFRLATAAHLSVSVAPSSQDGHVRCPSLFNFREVVLMSFPMVIAIVENSLLLLLARAWSRRCFCSAVRPEGPLRVRIESTHVRNSLVRSWTGIKSKTGSVTVSEVWIRYKQAETTGYKEDVSKRPPWGECN